MRLGKLFTKTRKESPKDEVSKNAILLTKAGYVHKDLAGVYSFMPLGHIVLQNIISIIRKEMNALGAWELSLASLQDKEIWKKTNRWDDEVIDVWFKTVLKNGAEVGLGTTHEEPLTAVMSEYISSYRDLPVYAYQFQTKFRNEVRAKSGIMRCREFVMKDLYSFSRTQAEHDAFYAAVRDAYTRIFAAVGLGDSTYPTFASGGAFSKYSEEFQTVSSAGEDVIFVHEERKIALNKEVLTPEVLSDLQLSHEELVEKKSIEVGNIFTLGTRFSEPLGLAYVDERGERKPVIMGSYGIGPGRLMGTIVETLSDDKGIVWPKAVAPAHIHLVSIGDSDLVRSEAERLYTELTVSGLTVLYDDREARTGEKLADAELLGIPHCIIVGEKSLASGGVEHKIRQTGVSAIVPATVSAIRSVCV